MLQSVPGVVQDGYPLHSQHPARTDPTRPRRARNRIRLAQHDELEGRRHASAAVSMETGAAPTRTRALAGLVVNMADKGLLGLICESALDSYCMCRGILGRNMVSSFTPGTGAPLSIPVRERWVCDQRG